MVAVVPDFSAGFTHVLGRSKAVQVDARGDVRVMVHQGLCVLLDTKGVLLKPSC